MVEADDEDEDHLEVEGEAFEHSVPEVVAKYDREQRDVAHDEDTGEPADLEDLSVRSMEDIPIDGKESKDGESV